MQCSKHGIDAKEIDDDPVYQLKGLVSFYSSSVLHQSGWGDGDETSPAAENNKSGDLNAMRDRFVE